jgi:hypothetical protein
MAEHGGLEIPLPDAAADEQAEQPTQEPVPQGYEHLFSLNCKSAQLRTPRWEPRSTFFTPQASPDCNGPCRP